MKNNAFLFVLFFVSSVLLGSCDKDPDAISKVTYFPEFTMNGEQTEFVWLGEAYTDLGATATEQGKPINVDVLVSGDYASYSGTSVDVNAPNRYEISYSAKNNEGYSGSVTREVFVFKNGDLETSIEGLYLADAEDHLDAFSGLYVMIWEVEKGVYQLSDALAGFYAEGLGFGAGYRAEEGWIVSDGNEFVVDQNAFFYAIGVEVTVNDLVVTPADKTIQFTSSFSLEGEVYNHTITLTQVAF